jgi:lipopolysaccharide export system protein LptA
MNNGSLRFILSAVLIAGLGWPHSVKAQTFSDAFSGFGSKKSPIEFNMDSFELDERKKVAVLNGNVVIQQDKTVLKTRQLRVYYRGSFSSGGLQKISRMVATGKVVLTSGNQAASGNSAVFDMAAQTLILNGNVVLSQGENVIAGEKLIINMRTGKTKIVSGKKRIRMMLAPQTENQAKKKKPPR